ncbi:MAG: hypothetical protein KKC71_02500 [Chloroflexi bacterium]|nr:hypothetical protein [Chloroflexota bacterium]
MNNAKLKYWPIFFLVTFVEGVITLVWLGLIPPDAKSSVFLGFSFRRLLMIASITVILATLAFGGWYSWRHRDWRERWLNPSRKPRLFHRLTVVTAIIALGAELILLYLRYYDPERLAPFYVRSRPLLGYLFLSCTQLVVWFLVLRFGSNLRVLGRRLIIWILAWGSISFLAYLALSPTGQGELHTWWYIQTFDPRRNERHGADYCALDYQGSFEYQYQMAKNIRQRLANVDRQKALLAIFNKVTKEAKTNTEKHLRLLEFIQKSSYHTPDIASYSEGDWVYDPLVLLELGDMWCTQGAILAIDLFGAAGYPGRLVQLAHHQIAEIYYDGDWHYFDTDLFGNGETVLDDKGNIPSVAEMSRGEYQKLDVLPAYQEFNVMDCTGSDAGARYYPSYFYFSSEAYQTDVPQGYYMGLAGAHEFEGGWMAIDIAPNDKVLLNDFRAQHTPTKPIFSNVQFDTGYTILTVSFTATDPDNDLAGYRVFFSNHSRGWDYNQFYGDESTKVYWANPGGWKPDMYEQLFELPPSNIGLIRLDADQEQVDIPIERGMSYFVTVMPFDSYGQSVGRVLYPASNELKVTVP